MDCLAKLSMFHLHFVTFIRNIHNIYFRDAVRMYQHIELFFPAKINEKPLGLETETLLFAFYYGMPVDH